MSLCQPWTIPSLSVFSVKPPDLQRQQQQQQQLVFTEAGVPATLANFPPKKGLHLLDLGGFFWVAARIVRDESAE